MKLARNKQGFTLVEVLISLFVLSVSITFAVIIINTIKLTRDGAHEGVAFRIANSKLDAMRAAGYDSLPADGPFTADGLSSIPQGAASTTATVYNEKIKEVLVGVSWLGSEGNTRYVSLTTLITEVGGL